ncbi:PadR family transcriptional regulator [Candidatus Pyrohabitans sp.]
MPLRRLKEKTTKEVLWLYILRLLKERELYAYEIKPLLRERFGISPALVTPYVVLYRLEREGYVEARRSSNKKYYRITPRGERLLEEGISYLRSLIKRLELP